MSLKNYDEDFFNMCELGFVACNRSDESSALQLFNAAAVLRPDHNLPKLGIGYLHFLKLELEYALEAFNEILDKEPENELARAFKGIATAFKNDEKNQNPGDNAKSGIKLLEEAAKNAGDDEEGAQTKAAAETGIEFVNEYIGAKLPQGKIPKDKGPAEAM